MARGVTGRVAPPTPANLLVRGLLRTSRGVYPEGTRSRDGMLHRGTLGPARLAATSGAPIVPVGLVGTELVLAPDQRLPRVKKEVQVRFGTPLRPDRQDANDRAQLRDVTDALMNDIAALCGQEYVDRDAPLANV
jgi:1-acyl-sn-glycerol-3-phosphate acyltransferase